jgi:SAM-dependent methyltransferase
MSLPSRTLGSDSQLSIEGSRVEAIKNAIRRHLSLEVREKLRPRMHWVFVGLHLISARFHTAKQIWGRGLSSELAFWDYWLTSHGSSSPEDYLRRIDPMSEISKPVSNFIQSGNCKILDVGAGPLTILGKLYRGQRLDITAVDVLADEYAHLLAKHGINPTIKTQTLESEKLTARFAHNTFDISYSENSLDHSYDPVLAIEEMLDVTKSGGAVVLIHIPNVASESHYLGLHQWNFKNVNGDFVVSSPCRPTVNITNRFRGRADIEVGTRLSDGSIVVTMFKRTATLGAQP